MAGFAIANDGAAGVQLGGGDMGIAPSEGPTAPRQLDDSGALPIVPGRVRILIVDDDAGTRAALATLIDEEGYETMTAGDGWSALAVAKRWSPDLIVTDLVMPKMDGNELCRRIHEIDPDLPVIVITAMEQSEAGLECLRAGAEDYISKPVQHAALTWCIQRALERRASKRERERLRIRSEELCRELQTVNEHLIASSARAQKLAEAEAQQRAELNALLERMGEGIIIVEVSGQVRMMNEAACALLGLSGEPGSVDALDALEIRDLQGEHLSDRERPIRRALRGDDFADYEVTYVLPDGRERRVVTTATSVRDTRGAVVVAIIVLRDVTQLRYLEQQRHEYTALISHDLANPLNVIFMTAQLLHESLAEQQLSEHVTSATRIMTNCRRMASMLDELTQAARLESRDNESPRAPCDLRKLVADMLGRFDESRAQRVTVESAYAGPCVVLADAGQLERCITNLVTNALKYSGDEAPVVVKVARAASHVELDVVDFGIGIAPESVKHIFDRYYRTKAGKGRAAGLGLGLYIARLIAEGHGGRIDVRSELGKGSTFKLILPLS